MKKPKKYNQQPNKITLSRQKFNVIEKRIVYLIINQLDTGINVDEDLFQNKEFNIPVKELGETNYKRIREECKRLRYKEMGIPQEGDKYVFWDINPFPEAKLTNNGTLYIKMLDTAVPYFIELKKGFTTYQLKAALSLNSTYSQRLYELLSKYKDTGVWNNIEIVYLKRLLAIENKYPEISMFRQRVLNPAQKELKNKTDISFIYELYKTGRRYTHITFYIKYRKPQQSTEPENLTEKQERCKSYLDQFGIQDKKLQKSILHNKQAEFWKWLHWYKQNKENISNPAGHLLKSLGIYQTTK
ncbi:MAG: replication initiation protein [Bacteroidales bacterium]